MTLHPALCSSVLMEDKDVAVASLQSFIANFPPEKSLRCEALQTTKEKVADKLIMMHNMSHNRPQVLGSVLRVISEARRRRRRRADETSRKQKGGITVNCS